ncbi:Hypothetical predicted protein [Podarcis lilfordi]|uniref:Uncharacterized protein n=1 Tax=Podarcis lilfordi TaxID=74358 RepID=A0AA35KWJ3_9SAUR|nr:Hypothetical predicted protein [Podarcis lilfordi]
MKQTSKIWLIGTANCTCLFTNISNVPGDSLIALDYQLLACFVGTKDSTRKCATPNRYKLQY